MLLAISREDKVKGLSVVGLNLLSDRKLRDDENLWCREFESGPLDEPENIAIPEATYQ